MAFKNRFIIDEIRSVAFGGITGAYAAVGSALDDPARIFILNNISNQDLLISLDGVTDHLILPAGAFKLIDVAANKGRDDGLFVAAGTVFYVKHNGVAPTSGSVYLEVIHS